CCRFGIDVDAAALSVEADGAVDEREERVVASDADVAAGVELGAALADDDAARGHELAGEDLDAPAPGVRCPAVLLAALTFLMRHDESLGAAGFASVKSTSLKRNANEGRCASG